MNELEILLKKRVGMLSKDRAEYFRISSKIQRLRDPSGCRYRVNQWKIKNGYK